MIKKKSYDYIIIGSGFGGSVSALRLAEKGYKVLVIEKGKWFKANDFPKTNWDLKKWLWIPFFRFFGILKISFFRHLTVLSGVGVGGGSLVYANTLPKPKNEFYTSGSWSKLCNWKSELEPFYQISLQMLGAVKNPNLTENDIALKKLASSIHKASDFSAAKVAVFFNKHTNKVKDPFFNGKGPDRNGCNYCGACMTGCRYNAKNTLDKNYLYLAQQLGVEILAEHKVKNILPISNNGSKGYIISYKKSTQLFTKIKKIKATGIILSAGVLGTIPLLLNLKKSNLPNLSNMIGRDIRSNNEALILNTTLNKNTDMSKGIAIGSILKVDKNSHIEPVRYGSNSGFWRLLMLPMVSEKYFVLRILKLFKILFKEPINWFKILTVKNFSKQTSILLFMQDLDGTLQLKKGLFRIKTTLSKGKPPSAFISKAHSLAKKHSKIINGKSLTSFTETITGIPSTAHILGGAVMGKNKNCGVIDSNNKVFGYENMYICDGSMISANLGVNPSLTITAISERAMSKISSKK